MSEGQYVIKRFYRDNERLNGTIVFRSYMTLEQAQEHCSNPESSSETCTSAEGIERTKQHGPWFDGYDKVEA